MFTKVFNAEAQRSQSFFFQDCLSLRALRLCVEIVLSSVVKAHNFTARVLSVVRRIPPGKVATYGDVAAAAGRPQASRAVGNIMRTCRDPAVSCHRVIAAAGGIGGYGRDIALKRALLRAEGLTVTLTRVENFEAARWRGRH